MKTIKRRRQVAAGRRRSGHKIIVSKSAAGKFLRRTFYYLKGEQFLKASNRLLCEAV